MGKLTVTVHIDEIDCDILCHDVLDIQAWVEDAVKGKILSCKKRMLETYHSPLLGDMSNDDIILSVTRAPDYVGRQLREAQGRLPGLQETVTAIETHLAGIIEKNLPNDAKWKDTNMTVGELKTKKQANLERAKQELADHEAHIQSLKDDQVAKSKKAKPVRENGTLRIEKLGVFGE